MSIMFCLQSTDKCYKSTEISSWPEERVWLSKARGMLILEPDPITNLLLLR